MELVFLLILISVIINAINAANQRKKKQEQEEEEARRRKLAATEAEERAKRDRQAATRKRQPIVPTVMQAGTTLKQSEKEKTHVVRPFTEGGHVHVESTIAQEEECAEPGSMPYAVAESSSKAAAALPRAIVLSSDFAAMGILYAEILGKPKALRR